MTAFSQCDMRNVTGGVRNPCPSGFQLAGTNAQAASLSRDGGQGRGKTSPRLRCVTIFHINCSS